MTRTSILPRLDSNSFSPKTNGRRALSWKNETFSFSFTSTRRITHHIHSTSAERMSGIEGQRWWSYHEAEGPGRAACMSAAAEGHDFVIVCERKCAPSVKENKSTRVGWRYLWGQRRSERAVTSFAQKCEQLQEYKLAMVKKMENGQNIFSTSSMKDMSSPNWFE
jgi:hypothetical protein